MRLVHVVTLAVLAAGTAAAAGEITGRVTLIGRGGGDPRDAVVWFESDRPVGANPLAVPVDLRTEGKDFAPHVLDVPVGSTVRFPNADPILHNVFSVSPGHEFDLGLYGPDDARSHRFDAPGVVRVFCNVHHAMAAYVVVLDTPFAARPTPDGAFRIVDVPAGGGVLTVWHERTEPWTTRIVVPLDRPVAAELQLTRPRVPRHLDKDSRPYRTRRGRYD